MRTLFRIIIFLLLLIACVLGLWSLAPRSTPVTGVVSVQAPRVLTSGVPLPNGDRMSVVADVEPEHPLHVYSLERRTPDDELLWRRVMASAEFPLSFELVAMLPDDSCIIAGSLKSARVQGTVVLDPEGQADTHYWRTFAVDRGGVLVAHVGANGALFSIAATGSRGCSPLGADSCVRWGRLDDLRESSSIPETLELSGDDSDCVIWRENVEQAVVWTLQLDGNVTNVAPFSDGSFLFSGTFMDTVAMDGTVVLKEPRAPLEMWEVFLVRWSPKLGVISKVVLHPDFGSDGWFSTYVTPDDTVLVASAFRGSVELSDLVHIQSRFRGFGTFTAEYSIDLEPTWARVINVGTSYPSLVTSVGRRHVLVRGETGFGTTLDIPGANRGTMRPFGIVVARPGVAESNRAGGIAEK